MQQRVYNAINGAELIDVLCKDLRETLSQDSNFRQHITFPELQYEISVSIKAYAQEKASTTVVKGSVATVVKETNKPVALPPDAKPRAIQVNKKATDQSRPDALRAGKGIPVNRVKTIPGLGSFEEGVIEPRSTREGGPATGRGVTIKNRASEGFTG